MNYSVNNISQSFNQPIYKKQGKPVNFGNLNSYYDDDNYEEQTSPAKHLIRNTVKFITGSAFNVLGFNAILFALQSGVRNGFLNKIINHYDKKMSDVDNQKLLNLAEDMRNKYKLNDVPIHVISDAKQAFYTRDGNRVVVGTKEHSALFHELGHAIEENKTKFLKTLQDSRGRGGETYNVLALGLFALLNINKNNSDGSPASKTLSGLSTAVPLIAYAPELITEGAATRYGLKYLKSIREDVVKKQLDKGLIKELPDKAKMISKDLYKNIKHSYIACFCTYLLIPVSLVIADKLDDWAHRRNRG